VGEGAVGLETFFLELAGLVLVEAALAVPAVGEEAALHQMRRSTIWQGVYFLSFYH
jgi:hypothetical protein